MEPHYNYREDNVLARCPDCNANTSFDTQGHSRTNWGTVIVDGTHQYQGNTYTRILWKFFRCNACSRGGVAKLHDKGSSSTAILGDFLPTAIERASLPAGVPVDIEKEFREAEIDAANGACRSASAMLRSVLEKTLKKNGYDEIEFTDEKGAKKRSTSLLHRIDAAAEDGVITDTRRRRAHENIRVLGNDALHEDWRQVDKPEYEDSHKYCQRFPEDFYDDRATVEDRLISKGRLTTK